MKGIILAGGKGLRLYPLTVCISKQLLPVYNKPMIFYPLCILMEAGIRDILIISDKQNLPLYKKLLGNGNLLGINISYIMQKNPEGIAQAFILGRDFIENDSCALILGDNIFYGESIKKLLLKACKNAVNGYATIFGYRVKDPCRFGIMEIDKNKKVLSVEEKPDFPKSDICITGLYFYDRCVCEFASSVEPSGRGEFEITSLNRIYMQNEKLKAEMLGRGCKWYDTGTPESLYEAGKFIRSIENKRGEMLYIPEEIAYKSGWTKKTDLERSLNIYKSSSYGNYLNGLLNKIC